VRCHKSKVPRPARARGARSTANVAIMLAKAAQGVCGGTHVGALTIRRPEKVAEIFRHLYKTFQLVP
jgi:hypothetical protein